ncbi:hypothetical protein C0431_11185 [bacterium]|nr:hypothetical protein [bacterium]
MIASFLIVSMENLTCTEITNFETRLLKSPAVSSKVKVERRRDLFFVEFDMVKSANLTSKVLTEIWFSDGKGTRFCVFSSIGEQTFVPGSMKDGAVYLTKLNFKDRTKLGDIKRVNNNIKFSFKMESKFEPVDAYIRVVPLGQAEPLADSFQRVTDHLIFSQFKSLSGESYLLP